MLYGHEIKWEDAVVKHENNSGPRGSERGTQHQGHPRQHEPRHWSYD